MQHGAPGPLAGRTVVTTRDTPGRLDQMLAELGALVLHVPLIEVEPVQPEAFGADRIAMTLTDAGRRGAETWLIATSQHGAAAAGPLAAAHPHVRLAAVGTRTAEVFGAAAGRAVERVPTRQTAVDLLTEFPAVTGRDALAVVLQGDLAPPTLADGLRERGYTVDAHVVYTTRSVVPDPDVRGALLRSDAVTFASGSAARSWAAAIGPATPPAVIAIGPTTADAAEAVGLTVTHVADTHDLDGLAAAVVAALEAA